MRDKRTPKDVCGEATVNPYTIGYLRIIHNQMFCGSNLNNKLPNRKLDVARVRGNLLYFVLRILREGKILISVARNHL